MDTTDDRDEMILRISRILDRWADEHLGDDPDWGPLEAAIPQKWCGGFMWMNRTVQDGTVIELYKHGITRNYLCLDHSGGAWRYVHPRYEPTPLDDAIDAVFDGLEAMGYDRETVYDEEFIRRKHAEMRAAGWTVISTACLDHDDLDHDVVTSEE